jgi:hypothetical protein
VTCPKQKKWQRSQWTPLRYFIIFLHRTPIFKEIGKLLSEIWRIKGLAEQEYGPQHPITKKLASMHADAQALLQEKTGKL